jgi:hypothetical protein
VPQKPTYASRWKQLDDQLEHAIRVAYRALVNSQDRTDQAAAWADLSGLVKRRSAESVRRLERARGLVKS